MASIHVARGIVNRVAKLLNKTPEDSDALMKKKVSDIMKLYSDENTSGMAFFDEVDMLALHVIGENRLMSKTEFERILKDVDLYEAVILQLRDVLGRAYEADEKLKFTAMLKNYYGKLNKPHKEAFVEFIGDIKRLISLDQFPESSDPNVVGLVEVVQDASKRVPEYVNKTKHKAFQIDRVGMVYDLLLKFQKAGQNTTDHRQIWA